MGLETIKWLKSTFTHIEKNLLGERVSVEQGNERRNECLKCDRLTNKSVLPFVEVKACSICKCPIDTKPFFRTHLLQALNPLIEKDKKDSQNIEIVTCPHPEGSKWIDIDKKYSNAAIMPTE
jgi:hypothetical protein